MTLRNKLTHAWLHYGAYLIAFLFAAVMFGLMLAKHNSFETRVYDFARFTQAIWNTPTNGFLFESIRYRSILGDHFSPIMALAAPLLRLWPDERLLFLIQVLNVVVAGLILYRLFHEKRPALAPWFLLAFFLNPALHEVTIFEVRRIVFALPFLALALYALSRQRRWLMLVGLLLTLLAKENVALFVLMIGLYLLIFERDWKWGAFIMALGFGWLLVVSVWVIPRFNQTDVAGGAYPQLYYFSYLGDSYEEIVQTVLADPLAVVRPLFQPTQLASLLRLLLPLGLILPFLKPEWVLFALPYTTILLLSADEDMVQIVKWYPATLLVVLFAAIAAGWERLPSRWEKPAMVALNIAALLGFLLFSPVPPGRGYEPGLYEVSPHDRLAAQVVAQVPDEAAVAAQPAYVPHLTLRSDIYHYPWFAIGREQIDYFLFDRHASGYPFEPDEMNTEITGAIANPDNVVVAEADQIFLVRNGGPQLDAFPVAAVAEEWIHLERVEVASRAENELFANHAGAPVVVEPGQQLRVTLYWEALAAGQAERTVSVRIADETGWLFAQQDSMPVGGARPSSAWREGEQIRDVYYLTVPPETPPGTYRLDVVLYDTFTQEIVPFAPGGEVLTIAPLVVDAGA